MMVVNRRRQFQLWSELAAALGVGVWLLLPALSVAGEKTGCHDAKSSCTATRSVGQAGFVVNLDASGKPVQAVPAGVVKRSAGSPQEGLTVEANPAGGIMVDLKGRFQRAAVAHRDAQGNVRIDCVPANNVQMTTGGKE